MKRIILLLALLAPMVVWGAEPLMLVKPGREIFVNFPSAILPDKAVTVFLPEAAVPLHQKYPVVYLLGAMPKDATEAQAVLDRSSQKAILVGVNVEEKDLTDPDKIVRFFSQELVPYIDTNYLTKDEPRFRAIAAKGAAQMPTLAGLLKRKQLFGRAFIVNSGTKAFSFVGSDPKLRVLAIGKQNELAVLWQTLQEMGKVYGPDVALQMADTNSLFDKLNLDYLFAPAEELLVTKAEGKAQPDTLFITPDEKAYLKITAILKNGMRFDYIALNLHLIPPYLSWNPAEGTLSPIAGATVGKVKISTFVDKIKFNTKIKLKK